MNLRPLLSIFSLLLLAAGAGVCAPPAAVPYVWKNVAVGGGGYVTDVYCHPKQKDLVYIRTDVGGFYRWDAPASRWVPITDGFGRDRSNYYGGEGLALDPSDPKIVYIATGKYEWASPPGTIFKSGDQGRTWKKLPINLKMGGNEDHRWGGPRLVISPFHPSVLLFGSRHDGLWRSADGGASWARVTTFLSTGKDGVGITAVAFGAKTAGVVYAASFGDGVYQSGDDGLTWRKTVGGPAEVERLATSSDGALYATHAHGVGKYAGAIWADVTPAPNAGKAFGGLAVNPCDSRDLLTTAQTDHLRLFRSRDGGATWAEKKTETRSTVPWYGDGMKRIQYVAGLTFDPCVAGRVWLSDWYATYRTENIDANLIVLTNHEHGHEELVVFTLACPPGGPTLLSGTADVDGFVHDALDTFPHGLGDYYGGKGPTFGYTEGIAWCAGHPTRVARAGVTPWNKTGGVALSRDGGRTWTTSPSWNSPILAARIAVSPTDPDNLVVLRVGPGPALVTRDGGHSWHDVAGLPDRLISDVWNWQTPLAADGAQANVFYVYGGGQVYKSTDGGASFTVSASGLPGGGQALVTVPGQGGDVWLALGDQGLSHSSDGGLTFHALPPVKQASLFAVGKAAPKSKNATLYLDGALSNGRKGIFRSLDGGVSWEAINDPREPVGDDPNAMAASFDTFGLVFVGTNGRGIYYGQPVQH